MICKLSTLHIPTNASDLSFAAYGNIISGSHFSFLTDYCTQLRTLYLCSYELTDVSIESLCATCRHLLHLSLNSCGCLTDASLVAIALTYPLLQSLEMRACNFTDAGLEVLVEKCRDLRSVSFCGMVHITNIGLTALWKANPNLLHVRWPMDVAKSLH